MNRRFRLRKRADFKRVRDQGKSYAHPLLVLVALPNGEVLSRVAVTAGRSVGKATQRNRAKRMLRAAAGSIHTQLAAGWDIILIARRPLLDAAFQEVNSALAGLLKRARLIASDDQPGSA